MILTEFLPPQPDRLWQLARQMGIRHAIVKAAPELTGLGPARPTRRPATARWGDCLPMAGMALLLCSDAGRYITGQDIFVDGGMSLP